MMSTSLHFIETTWPEGERGPADTVIASQASICYPVLPRDDQLIFCSRCNVAVIKMIQSGHKTYKKVRKLGDMGASKGRGSFL